jgi:hypothetical protein
VSMVFSPQAVSESAASATGTAIRRVIAAVDNRRGTRSP